jgi:hypothetical protein
MIDKVWTQRDGTMIHVKDMTLSHLRNSIEMVKRQEAKLNEAITGDKGRIDSIVVPMIEHINRRDKKREKLKVLQEEFNRRPILSYQPETTFGVSPVKCNMEKRVTRTRQILSSGRPCEAQVTDVVTILNVTVPKGTGKIKINVTEAE